MRFLLTNDDGFDAPGIAALHSAACHLGSCYIVAPTSAMSGCGHQVTTDKPLLVRPYRPECWHVDGTPADCVRIARHALKLDFDYVLSGINAGGNLGCDTFISGTVAAVREGALLGIPGIAFSQYRKRDLAIVWEQAAAWAQQVLKTLLQSPPSAGSFWNVNFPHLMEPEMPELVHCPSDPSPHNVGFETAEAAEGGTAFLYQGVYANRPRIAGSDVATCLGGRIAVSKLCVG